MKSLIYRFEVWYQTKNLRLISEFLQKCDLGMDGMCIKDVITFTYTREEQPIDYFKELIVQAMAACEGNVVHIEGGKIE
jgi:hypothetical protein